MRVSDHGLEAAGDATKTALSKFKRGETVFVNIGSRRSVEQHRLFWRMLTDVAEATDFERPERLLTAIKLALGRYDLMMMPNGKRVPVPHSISFSSMTQQEFQVFMNDAIELICRDILKDDAAAFMDKYEGQNEQH